jgi:hypothetical protein
MSQGWQPLTRPDHWVSYKYKRRDGHSITLCFAVKDHDENARRNRKRNFGRHEPL